MYKSVQNQLLSSEICPGNSPKKLVTFYQSFSFKFSGKFVQISCKIGHFFHKVASEIPTKVEVIPQKFKMWNDFHQLYQSVPYQELLQK